MTDPESDPGSWAEALAHRTHGQHSAVDDDLGDAIYRAKRDAALHGAGIMKDGEHIAPSDFYAKPDPFAEPSKPEAIIKTMEAALAGGLLPARVVATMGARQWGETVALSARIAAAKSVGT